MNIYFSDFLMKAYKWLSFNFVVSLVDRATDLQNSVATRCLQLHGGWGYMWEYPIAKAFVDARVQPIYGGSNEIMKELISRTIVSDK
jgi:alkylation response protein AidB-like acyl-CoA dehydrogenase